MLDKLKQLEQLIIEQDPASRSLFVPGPSEAEVAAKLKRLPFAISDDALKWFSWVDMPQETFFERQIEILPGAYFMGLNQALEEFEAIYLMRAELEEIFPEPYRDQFRFLSDFSDGGFGFGAVDEPCQGRIIHLTIHENWHLGFVSLERLIDTAIACRREDVFNNVDVTDFDRYYTIAKRMNPGMDAWSYG